MALHCHRVKTLVMPALACSSLADIVFVDIWSMRYSVAAVFSVLNLASLYGAPLRMVT
ncbi:hypothetical protein BD311DRAFT_133481 [Dichomitus squalens]|uniref:Uncharacterized protein n=1 Tax=Dichomitus squalens TaxID=114155 RepID=A0A4Q9MTM2_9APHY|nr:hypothetical protein BD311DRAFT_133481 [Dichomitus squalens]